MKVISCYKVVPYEQSIVVAPDRTLSFDQAELMIGQYDLNAIEAGARLAEETGGELTALTVGTAEVENSKLRKSVLSRGPAKSVTVNAPGLSSADCAVTSAVLAEAIAKIGEFDLIICGEGSSDLYAQQVGMQLGERLCLPCINGVTSIKAGEEEITVSRAADGEVEILSVPLPAVISVASGINTTRVPSMKDILAAGKKPVSTLNESDVALPEEKYSETLSILVPEQAARACRIFEGDDRDTVAAFASALSTELK